MEPSFMGAMNVRYGRKGPSGRPGQRVRHHEREAPLLERDGARDLERAPVGQP